MPIPNPNTETGSFATTTKRTTAVLTTASADLDNPATAANTVEVVSISPPEVGGSLIPSLTAMVRATLATAAGLHLFSSLNAGVDKELVSSVVLPAHVVATGTLIPVTSFTHPDETPITEDAPYRLAKGETLYVSSDTALAGGIAVKCTQVDF